MEDSISNRTTKQEFYDREIEILELMAEGTHRNTICKTLAKQFRVSEKTIERHYYIVVSDMEKLAKHNTSELRTNLMARNDRIYRKSMVEGKYKTALDANMAQAKLGGLFDESVEESKPPEVITITEARFDGKLKAVSDEQE